MCVANQKIDINYRVALVGLGKSLIRLSKQLSSTFYEGRSKSSRKSFIMFSFCESAELNYYTYIDKNDLYLYSKFRCSGMNTMLTVVAMETVHHDNRPTFVHFCKKSMFSDDVAFCSLPCFFHQTLYEQSSICLR